MIESEGNPKTDPVVLWYNGGPGAASMFGLLVELGPYMLNEDSLKTEGYNQTGIPSLVDNPFSWTKSATVIAVNNPPPIGFSYCDPAGPAADGYSCGPWNDSLVAQANHQFLTNFFTTEFPEYAKNDLYITGESYAGIYVPNIAKEILKAPGPINLKGFAVGDGCMGTDVLCGSGNPDKGPYYQVEFLHGHGQVSEKNYKTIIMECPEAVLRSGSGESAACAAALKQMNANLGGFFGYSLYDDCVYDEAFGSAVKQLTLTGMFTEDVSKLNARTSRSLGDNQPNGYPCPGPAMHIWLNHTSVKKALNVPANARFNNGDNGVGFNYTLTETNVLPFYAHVIQNTSLRVLVYNGDTDPGINSMVTQDKYFNYFSSIGLEPKREWRPWTLDGKQRMGGYVVEYPTNPLGGDFNYLTIRGAGHMVPEYKPQAALSFLTHFLKGEGYPEYVPAPSRN